jgi:hypothetical protein
LITIGKEQMRTDLLAAIFSTLLIVSPALAVEAPTEMQHIVAKYQESTNEHSEYTKEYWRSGRLYGRENGPSEPDHQEVLMFGPHDFWLIEMKKKRAGHMKTAQAPDVRLHVVKGNGNTPKLLSDLEFGSETAFFQKHQASTSKKRDLNGAEITEYSMPIGNKIATLDVDASTLKPKRIEITRPRDKKRWTISYLVYETLPFSAAVFTPPSGLTVSKIDQSDLKHVHRTDMDQKVSDYRQRLQEKTDVF